MKFYHLHIRVTKETKDTFKQAAKELSKARGWPVTMSAFITEAALAAAPQAHLAKLVDEQASKILPPPLAR